MSTNTPTTATTGSETTMADRSRPGTTAAGQPDRWAASPARSAIGRGLATDAPATFDPFCTRRLRNCIDAENAAFPDTH